MEKYELSVSLLQRRLQRLVVRRRRRQRRSTLALEKELNFLDRLSARLRNENDGEDGADQANAGVQEKSA